MKYVVPIYGNGWISKGATIDIPEPFLAEFQYDEDGRGVYKVYDSNSPFNEFYVIVSQRYVDETGIYNVEIKKNVDDENKDEIIYGYAHM